MKLKSKLMMFTAVTALSASMAFAAINPETLAQSYRAAGYTYVEVKVGPTQTKLEAVKGDRKVEVVYDNATNAIIKQEFDDADDDYVGRTGVEIETSASDFEDDGDDDENDDRDDDENDDDAGDDDKNDDESDDKNDDDNGDDDDEGDDNDNDDNDNSEDEDSSGGDDGDDGDES